MSYTEVERQQLLDIARDSIRFGLKEGRPLEIDQHSLPESLLEKRATFVTLNEDGKLRPGMRGRVKIRSGWKPLGWVLFHKPWNYVRVRWF